MKYTTLALSVALLFPVSSYGKDFNVSAEVKPQMGSPTLTYTVNYTGPKHYKTIWCGGTVSTMSMSSTPTQSVFIVQDHQRTQHQRVNCYSSRSSSKHIPENLVYEFDIPLGG